MLIKRNGTHTCWSPKIGSGLCRASCFASFETHYPSLCYVCLVSYHKHTCSFWFEAIYWCDTHTDGQKCTTVMIAHWILILFSTKWHWIAPGVEERDREIQVEGRGQKELKLWPWSGFSLSTQMQSSSQNRCYDVHWDTAVVQRMSSRCISVSTWQWNAREWTALSVYYTELILTVESALDSARGK